MKATAALAKIAVIGAGVAGLTAARRLAPHAEVELFEKSRGPGGRLANRRTDRFAFDFGAQYFTARDPAFRSEVERLAALDIVRPWPCRFVEIERNLIVTAQRWDDGGPHFVGTGRMTAMAASWAEGLAIRRMTRITGLGQTPGGWVLATENGGVGPYDFVVVAIPAPQAAAIIPARSALRDIAGTIEMSGCFALMLGYDSLPDLGFDAARFKGSALSWLTLCQSRPGHTGGAGMVILSDNEWADRHIEEPAERVTELMMQALAPLLGGIGAPLHRDLHRWRYANCSRRQDVSPLIDEGNRLAVCGDWTREGRVEAAFLSGLRTAEAIITRLGRVASPRSSTELHLE
jgi:predicted NAD/FAD-dependent oxidoreductase